MDRAVDLEAARQAAAGEHTIETFTRNTQHFGLLLATVFVGLALGVLFGVVHHLRRAEGDQPWGSALRLGAGGFFGMALVPFLRYPPNPPGVGDGATIETRSNAWLACVVIGLVGASVAGLLARQLRERGTHASVRQLAVVVVATATIALTFVLPDNTDQIVVPVGLVWDFRMLSLATLVLLWGGLAAAFGLAAERAARHTKSEPLPVG